MTPLIASAVFVHGVWYLWALVVGSFVFARQFRWAVLVMISWAAGSLLAALFTGQPVAFLIDAVNLPRIAFGMHETSFTLVTELRPADTLLLLLALMVLAGLILFRHLGGLKSQPLARNPAFWLAIFGWVLGAEAARFWVDWGAPAMLVLLAGELEVYFETRFPAESLNRLGLVAGLAVIAYVMMTNDVDNRWTQGRKVHFISGENPGLAGWLPEKDAIFYADQMETFFHTFFRNPQADWRYMVGFEPALMPPDDFRTYQSIRWNLGDWRAYIPWVKKMRPQDLMVLRDANPKVPGMEWNYSVPGFSIGRVIRTNTPPDAAPTAPPAE